MADRLAWFIAFLLLPTVLAQGRLLLAYFSTHYSQQLLEPTTSPALSLMCILETAVSQAEWGVVFDSKVLVLAISVLHCK